MNKNQIKNYFYFVSLGPFQYNQILKIIKLKDLSHDDFSIISYHDIYPSNNNFKNLLEHFKVLDCIVSSIKKHSLSIDYHLYIAHPRHIITNILSFSGYFQTVNLIQDGTPNYIDIRVDFKIYIKFFIKKIISRLKNYKFTLFSGHTTGVNVINYNEIYGYSVRRFWLKEYQGKLIDLCGKIDENDTLLDDSSLLIVSQPLKINYKKINNIINKFIQENPKILNVIIKKHPREKRAIKLKLNDSINIQFLNDDVVIENLFEEIKPKYVIGYSSNALIMLKIQNPDIDVFSFIECDSINTVLNDTVKLFKDFKIKFI